MHPTPEKCTPGRVKCTPPWPRGAFGIIISVTFQEKSSEIERFRNFFFLLRPQKSTFGFGANRFQNKFSEQNAGFFENPVHRFWCRLAFYIHQMGVCSIRRADVLVTHEALKLLGTDSRCQKGCRRVTEVMKTILNRLLHDKLFGFQTLHMLKMKI